MESLPFYVSLLFIVATGLTAWLFLKAAKNLGLYMIVALALLAIQTLLASLGFFTDLAAKPPHFIFLPGPPLIVIGILFISKKGRNWLDSLDLKMLTWLHVVRIPVEITLYLLCMHHMVPKIMTFEGFNPDILSGITAIIMAIQMFKNGAVKKYGLLIWNIVCLGLLVNIVYHAIFSTPYPFQKYGFEQPNIAVFYFPFIWLPGFIVPTVLLAHLASIRQLLKMK